jgi:hypothetical protein
MSKALAVICVVILPSVHAIAQSNNAVPHPAPHPAPLGSTINLVCDYVFESKWIEDPQTKGTLLKPSDASTHFIAIDLNKKTADVDGSSYKITLFDDNFFQLDDDVSLGTEQHSIMLDRRNGHFGQMSTIVQEGKLLVTSQIFGVCGTQVPKF